MKLYSEYLTEAYNNKTYEFKIGVAGDNDGVADKLEMCLKKFGVTNITPGKKTPIQERPLDFPQLQNEEVTYYEATITYPTHAEALQEYLGYNIGKSQSHIMVRNMNAPQEVYQEINDAPYEIKLTKEDMGGESAQENVGNNRVMDLLKELETARKEHEYDPTATAKTITSDQPKTEITDVKSKSPIGS
jgi:hypothetical protein